MTGWIILGVIVLLLVLLCLTPVGVYLRYEADLLLRLLIGPFVITLLPKKEKTPEAKKKGKKAAQEGGTTADSAADGTSGEKKKSKFPKPNKEQILYTIKTLPGILKKALRRAGRGILLSPLRISMVFAGDDPADVAEKYGKAYALVSTLFPELKKLVRMKDEKISLSIDFEKEQMELAAEVGVHLRIGTILHIAFSAAFSLLRWFVGYRKLATPVEGHTKKNHKHDQAEAA